MFKNQRYINGSKLVKSQIVENIFEHIRVKEGRFYRYISTNTFTGDWSELKQEEVYTKVKQTLRDYTRKAKAGKEKKPKK